MKNLSGKLIVFEGVEGCGKTTQSQLLSKYFYDNNIDHLLVREPGGTETGEQIRSILLHSEELNGLSELFLLSAARQILISQKVIPALESGKIVISDRFYFSSLAYQGYARGIDESIILNLSKVASLEISPDIAFLLDISTSQSFNRKINDTKDRFERESSTFHNSVRNGYLSIAKSDQDLWRIIEGDKQVSEVHQEIIFLLNEKLSLITQ
ncbi:MAG: dTMP kinase [SAR202 cluster bacterium]|nr:dTMP kinase [SAR202 cluster bacterium]